MYESRERFKRGSIGLFSFWIRLGFLISVFFFFFETDWIESVAVFGF